MTHKAFLVFVILACFRVKRTSNLLDVPIEDCLTKDVDLLLFDVGDIPLEPLHKKILITAAGTFFEDGVVTANSSRIKTALSTTNLDVDNGFFFSMNFSTMEPMSQLLDKIDKDWHDFNSRKESLTDWLQRNYNLSFITFENASDASQYYQEKIKDVFSLKSSFGWRQEATHAVILTAWYEDIDLKVKLIDRLLSSNDLQAKVYFVVTKLYPLDVWNFRKAQLAEKVQSDGLEALQISLVIYRYDKKMSTYMMKKKLSTRSAAHVCENIILLLSSEKVWLVSD